MTPNFMASDDCRRELNFALSRKKPVLTVMLEPTKMPLGMEMQISGHQSVLRYKYATEELFIEKICDCPDLRCCNCQPSINPVPQQPEKSTEIHEDPYALRQWQNNNMVSRYGSIIASISSSLGALILIVVATLLFANYHQQNLVDFTSFPPLPDRVTDFLSGVWHELPDISSPEYRNLQNLPPIAWLIAVGWFLRSIGSTFKHHAVAEKLVSTSMLVHCVIIAGHIALCACAENAALRNAPPQLDAWLPYYFPAENLVAIVIMIVVGCVVGRAVDWIVRKILCITLKVKL